MNTMYINPIENKQDDIILDYNHIQTRLARLGNKYVGGFPMMTLADTRRLNTVGGQNVGDSHRQEGWVQTGAGPSQRAGSLATDLGNDEREEREKDNIPLGASSLQLMVD
jgi:hypothetical protein